MFKSLVTSLILLTATNAVADTQNYVLDIHKDGRTIVTPVSCEMFTPAGGYFGEIVTFEGDPETWASYSLNVAFSNNSVHGTYRIECFFGVLFDGDVDGTLVRLTNTFVR